MSYLWEFPNRIIGTAHRPLLLVCGKSKRYIAITVFLWHFKPSAVSLTVAVSTFVPFYYIWCNWLNILNFTEGLNPAAAGQAFPCCAISCWIDLLSNVLNMTAQPQARDLLVDHGLQSVHSLDPFPEKVFTHPDACLQHLKYNSPAVGPAFKIQPFPATFFLWAPWKSVHMQSN